MNQVRKIVLAVLLLIISLILSSCQQKNDLPPVMVEVIPDNAIDTIMLRSYLTDSSLMENISTIAIADKIPNPIDYLSIGTTENNVVVFVQDDTLFLASTNGYPVKAPKSCAYLFNSLKQVTSINLNKLDTSNVIDMAYMFHDNTSLTEIHIEEWDTSNVRDMTWMFGGCNSLETVDIKSWNTESLEHTNSMFFNDDSLTYMDLSNWTTPKLQDLECMFANCDNLAWVDLSYVNPEKVTTIVEMFYNCPELSFIRMYNFHIQDLTHRWDFITDCDNLEEITCNDEFAYKTLDLDLWARNINQSTYHKG